MFTVPSSATLAKSEPLRVLSIGNSYSQDSFANLYKFFAAEGYTNIVLGYLYKSGCKLEQHMNYAKNNEPAYTFFKNTSNKWESTANSTMLDGLTDEPWDIITLQQASADSGRPDTYDEPLDYLVNYINEHKTNKNAKLYWHMTWSWASSRTTASFATYYNRDPLYMYQCIADAVQTKVLTRDAFSGVIPTGTAVQNARSSYLGDTFHRDGTHLTHERGRFLASYMWYCTLTGNTSVSTTTLINVSDQQLTDGECAVLTEAVGNALKTPYEVTPSVYLTEEDAVRTAEQNSDNTRPSATMTDVEESAWYREAVDYVLTNDLMSGYGAGVFGPENTLTRAQVVQVLYNKEGKPATDAANPFSDIPADQWYCNAVRWGADKKVVSGYGGNVFKPDDAVTLEQVAVILHNYSGAPAADASLDQIGAHSDWAEPALKWAAEKGIFEGMPYDAVTGPATRAQTAQMLMNYLTN